MRRLFARWRPDPAAVRADAAVLIMEHGRLAYSVARSRAREDKAGRLISATSGHWQAVRQEIRRIEGRL